MFVHRVASITVGALLLVLSSTAQVQTVSHAPADPRQASIVEDFEARVRSYLDWRKSQAGSPPKPSANTAKLAGTQQQIATNVQTVRAGAKQGDIFSPPIAKYFRHEIAAALTGPSGAKVRASLERAEPVRIPVKVNQPYPPDVPLQSMPPTLLLRLPVLPKELEYRIVDHDLVLRDIAANLIIDFVPHAIPSS